MFCICVKFQQTSGMVFNLQSGHEYIVEMVIFNIYYVQWAATPKVGSPELRFFFVFCTLSYGALIFVKSFIKIYGTIFNLQSGHKHMVEMAMFHVQRAITPCVLHIVLVLYIYVKFGENISDGIKVMQRTRMKEALTDGRTDTQNFGRYNIIPSPIFMAGHKNVSTWLEKRRWKKSQIHNIIEICCAPAHIRKTVVSHNLFFFMFCLIVS